MDLDKLRAARREEAGENIEVVFGGETFEFPVEMPVEAVPYVQPIIEAHDNLASFEGAVLGLLKSLLGDERATVFMRNKPSLQDLQELLTGLLREYGVSQGEANASES